MTKKRLSDLLREEVSKDVENEAVVTTPTETEETPKTTTSRSRRTTPSAQDKKVVELTEALALAKEQVNTLQTQLKSLETELEDQKSLVQTLQKQLEQQDEQKTLTTHLSTQLDEAQTELEQEKQLVEKLYVELQKIQLKPLTQPEPEPLESPEPSQLLQTPEPPQPLAVKKVQSYEIRPRFVAPSSSPAHLSNDDIGWFD